MYGLCRSAIVCLMLGKMFAQSTASFVYLESFRKGPTRVMEQSLQVDLGPQNPTCEIRVKDQSGRSRYTFVCAPQRVGEGDARIIGWQVRLVDLQHKLYNNVLLSTPDVTQEHTQIGWLDPGKFARIPLTKERVVKVDGFYCVVQVKDSHFVKQEQPYLDHMTVDVRFTNTMPHSEARAKQEQAN